MKKKLTITAFALLCLLAGCNLGSTSSDSFATQVADEVYATQTAAARLAISAGNASQVTELARFTGDPVVQLAMSESGDVLAYVTVSGIHILDGRTFEERNFIPTPGRLEVFALSPDGRYAAGGGWSDLTLWSVTDATQQRPVDMESMDALAFTPDSRALIVLDWDSLTGFQVPSGAQLFTIPNLYDASALGFDPSTGQVVVAQAPESSDAFLTFFDPRSGAMTNEWVLGEPAGESIDSLAFSPDGQRLVLGWYGAPAEVWSTVGRQPALEFVLPEETQSAGQAAFLPGGRLLGMMTWGGPFQLWDLETQTVSREWPGERMAMASPGDLVVLADAGSVQARDLDSGEVIQLIDTRAIADVALSPDGLRIVLGMGDGSIELWDRRASAQERTLQTGLPRIQWLEFSPRGGYLQVAWLDGSAGLWRTSDWEPLTIPAEAGGLMFTPDEGVFISRASDPAQLSVWDAGEGAVLHTLTHAVPVTDYLLSPAGDMLAVRIEDGSIWLWDVRRGEFLRSLDDYLDWTNVDGVFNQDGSLLCAVGDNNTLRIWNLADATLAFSQQLDDQPEWIEANPDFSILWIETEEDYTSQVSVWRPGEGTLTAEEGRLGESSSDGELFVFHTWQEVEDEQGTSIQSVTQIRRSEDGEVLQTLPDPGWALGFSGDGSVLFTMGEGCEDEGFCAVIRLYSVESGGLLTELGGLDNYLNSRLLQSQSGSVIAGLTRSGTVFVWGLP